jgi:hypothetical protein
MSARSARTLFDKDERWGVIRGQLLFDSFAILNAVKDNDDGNKLEPDACIAFSFGANSMPRCNIEIEVNHRSPRETRELAAVYFGNNHVRSLVLLKVRTFAAACVV